MVSGQVTLLQVVVVGKGRHTRHGQVMLYAHAKPPKVGKLDFIGI